MTADTLVFTDRSGDQINGHHLTERHLKPLLGRTGLPKVRFHDLRHTFATLTLSEGVPVHNVSRMLGHSMPAVTLNVCAHTMPGEQADAARRLERLIGGCPIVCQSGPGRGSEQAPIRAQIEASR